MADGDAANHTPDPSPKGSPPDRVSLKRVIPPLIIHLGCLGVIWVGWSWIAVAVAVALYVVRMFVITAFYHRYFSHRTFQTSRVAQFAFGFVGASSAQRGPLWWAAHHRAHHRESDNPPDVHSPVQHGGFWSHMGWFLAEKNMKTDLALIPDWARYRELLWLDRWHILAPLTLGVGLFLLGAALARFAPGLETNGWQMLVWGFFISTTVLHHATFTINSLAHTIGSRRYDTHDDSRNNLFLALITFGEGWHNNHHFNPGSVRQGFYWWEIDMAYYGLRVLEKLGVVWRLNPVPDRVYDTPHMIQRPGRRGRAGS